MYALWHKNDNGEIHQSIFKRSMNTKTYHGYIGSFENYYFYLTKNWFNFFLHFPFHFLFVANGGFSYRYILMTFKRAFESGLNSIMDALKIIAKQFNICFIFLFPYIWSGLSFCPQIIVAFIINFFTCFCNYLRCKIVWAFKHF